MSASQFDYNTASHQGLQSNYSRPTKVPASRKRPEKKPLSEPLAAPPQHPAPELNRSGSSDPTDSKTLRPRQNQTIGSTEEGLYTGYEDRENELTAKWNELGTPTQKLNRENEVGVGDDLEEYLETKQYGGTGTTPFHSGVTEESAYTLNTNYLDDRPPSSELPSHSPPAPDQPVSSVRPNKQPQYEPAPWSAPRKKQGFISKLFKVVSVTQNRAK